MSPSPTATLTPCGAGVGAAAAGDAGDRDGALTEFVGDSAGAPPPRVGPMVVLSRRGVATTAVGDCAATPARDWARRAAWSRAALAVRSAADCFDGVDGTDCCCWLVTEPRRGVIVPDAAAAGWRATDVLREADTARSAATPTDPL